MRLTLTVILLMIACWSQALQFERCETNGNEINITLSKSAGVDLNALSENGNAFISKTFALPYMQADLGVSSITWNVYDRDGRYLGQETDYSDGDVYIANSFTFREMRGFTVNICNKKMENDSVKEISQVSFKLTGSSPVTLPESVSPAFIGAYKDLADNFETSYLRNLPIARPGLLIISHNSISDSFIAGYVAWKKSIGFDVYVAKLQNIGSTTIALKDYVLSQYNQYKPDHLLLLGDVTGSYAIPTNIYTSPDGTEHDADDNYYTMLTGNDYFPEMISGRFSFVTIDELLAMLNKTIYYEKNPYMVNTNWMTRGLVVAGNYAEGGLRPVTPVQMSKWLREKMLAKGFAAVDTVFYPPTLTGASAILSALNQGVQFVSYRGWGAADGWHYPSFHNQDLDNLNNGGRLHAVYSIVCNTGDFANALNPCFGEKWMRMGTVAAPKGAVAFVGPSDLHTKTNLNNTISSGMFSSILDKNERNFGASVLAGKIELYRNYPLDLASNQHVSFYFHVYNILSDPSLNLWVLVPQTIPVSVISGGTTIAQSASHIQIQAPNLNGAIVSGTKNNLDYTYATVHDGIAILPIDPEQTGNLTVTIAKDNFVPLVATLNPTDTPGIGVTANSLINQVINPGQNYQLNLTVKNYSSTALSGITANLTAEPDQIVTVSNPSQSIASLAAGATANLSYSFTVNGSTPYHSIVRFNLNFPAQSTVSSFELQTGGPLFTIAGQSVSNLNIGSTNNVTFQILNHGTADIQNATVFIQSSTNAASISTPNVSLGNLAVNQTGQFQATIYVEPTCFIGRNIPLVFTVSSPEGYQTLCYTALTAGNPSSSDPTGPDQYGYFAYDSNDLSYPERPTYSWVEIDPRDGGPAEAEVHLVMDDGSYTVNLPFTFRYYGQNYNSLTICSNGWVSFVPTWMSDFNNIYIPAPLGPYAQVSPYWDDLKGMKTGEDSLGSYFNDMRICNWYDQANNRYIVEWNDAYSQYTIDLMQNASLEKFQLILYPSSSGDGELVFQYHTISNPAVTSNFSTIGIENHQQDDGLLYSYADIYPVTAAPLQNGLAIKVTTDAPDSFVSNEDEAVINQSFVLGQNHPNPFYPSTTISFNINTKEEVILDVYNLKGQKIRTLHRGILSKGKHEIEWNGRDDKNNQVSSGMYIYRLTSGSSAETRKMLLLQ